jgi:hypothetical protein
MPKEKEKAVKGDAPRLADRPDFVTQAWRRAGFLPYDAAAVARKAAALGHHTPAVMLAPKPVPSKGPASSPSTTKTTNQASKKAVSAASKKPASASSKKSASAAAGASLGSRPPTAMTAALRAYHGRMVFNNPFVPGHCYFEAQALSHPLTNFVGEKKGAPLIRSIFSAFYGGPVEALWPLRTWIGQPEREKCPRYTLTSALAEDAAERDTALSLKRDRNDCHWAWGIDGFFNQRSLMMGAVNCDQITADLWKYNIDLDAKGYALIFLRPLVVCGVAGDNEFFHLYVLRLDKNEAARRAALIAMMAGGWQSDMNFEGYTLNSNGDVQLDGSNIPDRLFVFVHSSGSLAVGFGNMYSFSPLQFTAAASGDVIEWQKFNGGGVKWTRDFALESKRAEVALEEAKTAAKRQMLLEGRDLKNVYLTCKSFETSLLRELMFLLPGATPAAKMRAVRSVLRVFQFLKPRFLKVRQDLVHAQPNQLGSAPLGSVIIKHNGVAGVSGHFQSTRLILDDDAGQLLRSYDLGAPVIMTKKQKNAYDRHSFKDEWYREFPWVRLKASATDSSPDKVFCFCCMKHPQLRGKDKLASGELLLAKVRRDYLVEHVKNQGHQNSEKALAKTLGGGPAMHLERHITVTSAKEVICNLLRTVFTIAKEDFAFTSIVPLCQLQEANGLELGGTAYKNNTFTDEAIHGMGQFYTMAHTERIIPFLKQCGFWYAGDGTGNRRNAEIEMAFLGFFDMDKHEVVVEWQFVAELDLSKSADGASPDASAIFGTTDACLQERYGSHLSVWGNLVAFSLDGASVMVGTENSVATRILAEAPHAVGVHAVAHRLESAYSDAFDSVPFLEVVGELVRDCYGLFGSSMKSTAGLFEMAKVLGEKIVTLKPLHGIRWLASQVRALQAILRDWPVLVAYLEKVALDRVGCNFKTTTPSQSFVDKSIVLNYGGRQRKGKIVRLKPRQGQGPMASMSDVLVIKLPRCGQHATVELEVPKNEVVLALAASKEEALKDVKEWDLHLSLTQFRTVATLYLLYDLESILKRLSLLFQSIELTPSSLQQEIEHVYGKLEEMEVKNGIALTSFFDKLGENDIFEGFNLENREDGEIQFIEDRKEILTSTLFFMKGRFDPLLKNPILTWMRESFEHRLWPSPGSPELESWGIEALKNVCNHFSGLECMRNFDISEALHQWSRLKKDLIETPFFLKPYRKFWEHVSGHFGGIWGYPTVLIPIRISLLILPDTSYNERGIAEYNRIHTASRPNLEVSKVSDLFAIKHYGPKSMFAFNAEEMYEQWLGVVAEGSAASSKPKKRSLAALLRKIMTKAQSKHATGNGES